MIIDLDDNDISDGTILEQIFDDIHTVYKKVDRGLEVVEHIAQSDWAVSVEIGSVLNPEIYNNGSWIYHGVENPK